MVFAINFAPTSFHFDRATYFTLKLESRTDVERSAQVKETMNFASSTMHFDSATSLALKLAIQFAPTSFHFDRATYLALIASQSGIAKPRGFRIAQHQRNQFIKSRICRNKTDIVGQPTPQPTKGMHPYIRH